MFIGDIPRKALALRGVSPERCVYIGVGFKGTHPRLRRVMSPMTSENVPVCIGDIRGMSEANETCVP